MTDIDKKFCEKIIELSNMGHSQFEISQILEIDIFIVKRCVDLGLFNGLIKYEG